MRLRAAGLGLLAVLLYLPSLRGGFLAWDDRPLVLENPVVQQPLGEAVVSAFSGPTGTTYWPLRELSYALDRAVWGWDPRRFHLTNLVLYALLVAALYWAAVRNLGAPGAFLGVLLFAVHPLHAESVAWISGRKDLLAALFLFLAWGVLAEPGRLRLALGLAAYLAACLSKTAALPFPIAWWVQDRLLGTRRWTVWERLPFLLMMGCFGVHQARLGLGSGAAGLYQADLAGLAPFLATPARALWDQALALVLPFGLSPAYAVRNGAWDLCLWGVWVPVLLLRKRIPPRVLWGLAWTLLFLLPVINLGIPTSSPRADRYAFLPSAGFCLAAGFVLAARKGKWKGLMVASLGTLALSQGMGWRDDLSVWRPALRRDPASFLAAGGLGWGHALKGDTAQARKALNRLVRMDPDSPIAHHQLAGLLKQGGDRPHALFEYGQALERYAQLPKGRAGVRVPAGHRRDHARCLIEMGELLEPSAALVRAEEAVRVDPSDPLAWSALGTWRAATGDAEGAEAACLRAVALAPGMAEARWALARVVQPLAEKALAEGDDAGAQARFRTAADGCRRMLEAGQDLPEVRSRLGFAEIRLAFLCGDPGEAERHLRAALSAYERIPGIARTETDRRNLAGILRLRAESLAAQGDLAHAYQAARAANELQPGDADLRRMAAEYARALGLAAE